ncbi:sensor histidine kinase [Streptomyces sp. KLMMK]|uniref:sensor histidine kinase n=1 Tax=Streptomyces sp. KLMMK TaxID=3109353 RepID=UPI003000B589
MVTESGAQVDSEDTEAYLRPRARLMSTLGEELISNERVALTELVKNAYDADASLVVIRFNAPLEEGVGSIEVWDDGHGMSAETVRGTWMEIATSHRHRRPLSEGRGRRVLGAKGIGRFSAARLARVTSLATCRGDGDEVTLRLDWRSFSVEDAYLDQVPVNWSVRSPKVFAIGGEAEQLFDDLAGEFQTGVTAEPGRCPHGTVVRLEGLRQQWTAESIETLKRSLSRLLPPPPPTELAVPDQPEFSIYIETPPGELRHYSGFVSASETLAHPHYRLVGAVDADGQAHLTLTAMGVEEEVVIRDDFRQDTNLPSCGPVKLDIRTWDLDSGSLRRLLKIDLGARNVSEVRQLIRGNTGIALYRDGFRVQPFGETGYDWLEFDQRRVNNPTMRLSNNQVAGFVYVTADGNPGLRDRSHREGLIDSPEYEELKRIMVQAVSRLETWRYRLRRPEPPRSLDSKPLLPPTEGGGHGVFQNFTLAPLRDVVNQRYPDDAVLGRALDEAAEAINDSVQKVQEIISQFSRLATLGTLVDVVLHDGRAALTRIAYVLRRLNRLAKGTSEQDPGLCEALTKVHTDFSAQEKALDRLFTRVEPLSGRQRGRPKNISLHEAIDEAVSVHEAELAKQGITVTVGGEDVTVTAEPSDIAQVILNLVGNAIYWLSTLPEGADRCILITTERTPDGEVDIDVSDNGPGVREEIKDLIFDTYFSDKPDGIGLGLSIAGSVVKDFYDGDLYLVSPGPLAGACFRARLRRRVG